MAAALAAMVLLGSEVSFVPQTSLSTSDRAAPFSHLRGQSLAGAAEQEESNGSAPAQHALAFGAILGLLLSVAVASPVAAYDTKGYEAADPRLPTDKSPRKLLIQDKDVIQLVPAGTSALESKLARFEIKAAPIDFVSGGKNPVTDKER